MAAADVSGAEFVRGTVSHIAELSADVKAVKEDVARLLARFSCEASTREEMVKILSDRITTEVKGEAGMRSGLESRVEQFESMVRKWMGALGIECQAFRERLAAIDKTMADHATRQASVDVKVSDVQHTLPTKATASEVQQLQRKLSNLSDEVVAGRGVSDDAIATLRSTTTAFISEMRSHIERQHMDMFRQQADIGKKATIVDLAALSTRVDNVVADCATRAASNDVRALELRAVDLDKTLDNHEGRLSAAAAADEVRGIHDRLAELAGEIAAVRSASRDDVQAMQTSLTAVHSKVEVSERKMDRELEQPRAVSGRETKPLWDTIEVLKARLTSLERQAEQAKESLSGTAVALEMEIRTKAKKI